MSGKQVMIVGIENGWLVQVAPPVKLIQGAQQTQQQPLTTYCADYDAVCECLKDILVIE